MHIHTQMHIRTCTYTLKCTYTHIRGERFLPIGMCLHLVQDDKIRFSIPATIQFLILTITNWDVNLPLLSEGDFQKHSEMGILEKRL